MMPPPPVALDSDRDVVSQIKVAFSNPLPLLIGALIGALVPLATYTVGHAELGTAGWGSVPGAIVIGGCLFSAITVYKWGRRAFNSALKAVGFVVLSEGVMTFSSTPWLSVLMLGCLIAINAVANGSNLAVAHLDAERLRKAVELPDVTLLAQAPLQPPVPSLPIPAPLPIVPEASALVTAIAMESKPARKRARSNKPKVTKDVPFRRTAATLN